MSFFSLSKEFAYKTLINKVKYQLAKMEVSLRKLTKRGFFKI